MTPSDTDNVLLIGGYGRAGMEIAHLLLEHTSANITLSGRNVEHAADASEQLNRLYGVSRMKAAQVDITNRHTLETALIEIDLVIVCAPFEQDVAENVFKAVCDVGVDYIDINADNYKHQVIEQFSDQIHSNYQLILLDAGIVPGCPAVMMRHFKDASSIRFGVVMLDHNMPYGSAYDIMLSLQYPAQIYTSGDWRHASSVDVQFIDFGEPFGKRIAVPIDLPELRTLAYTQAVTDVKVYQAGFNPMVNMIFTVWKLGRLSHITWSLELGINLFLWANRHFTLSHGIQVQVTTDTQTLFLRHHDVYTGTAIPVVAAVRQILDEEIQRPQYGYMGHLIEPEQFLEDMEHFGMIIQSDNKQETDNHDTS